MPCIIIDVPVEGSIDSLIPVSLDSASARLFTPLSSKVLELITSIL